MPYIDWARRNVLSDSSRVDTPKTPGELNYIITKEILAYIAEKGQSYTNYNEVMGVLECVKQELYRRAVAKYEDGKIKENGDVF